MKYLYPLIIILFVFTSLNTFAGDEHERDGEKANNGSVIDRIVNEDIEVFVPSLIFDFKETGIRLKFKNPQHGKLISNNNKIHFIINGEDTELLFVNGEATYNHKFADDTALSIYVEEFSYNQKITAYPLWAVLLPVGLVGLWLIRRATKKGKKKPSIALK